MTLFTATSTDQRKQLDAFNEFNQKLINLPGLHQIINYSPLTISPDSYIIDAINLMNQPQDHSIVVNKLIQEVNDYVLVVEGKQLQGIFTIKDILRLITLNTNLSAVKIAEVMTNPVITLQESISASDHILTAVAILQQHCIQHLPIVDDQEELIGIVTEKDLLQALDIKTIFGIVEALQESFAESTTEHKPVNQQLEVIRWQIYNHLKQWGEKQVACNPEINQELQETLEELQIAEEELRQQNEQLLFSREITEAERQRYHNLFEFAPDGYFVTDPKGIIQEANQVASSLLSVPQNRLIGKPLVVYIAEQYRSNFVSRLRKLQNFQEWEMYLEPRKGSPFPASLRINPLYDHHHKHTGFLWSISNISTRKKLEAALRQDSDILEIRVRERTAELVIANEQLQQEIIEREQIQEFLEESQERLTLAMAAGNIGIWDWNIQTNQVLWSPTMGSMYGLSSNSLCPSIEDFLDLIYPEDRENFHQSVNQSIQTRIDFACEYRVIWSDGSLHWLSSRGKVHHDENGLPLRMIGTTRDISERKESEQQIYEQAALLNIATDGIFVRDLQSQIIFWNQGAERMYGWQSQEVDGKNTKDIFYNSTICELEKVALNTVLKYGNWQGELRKKTKSNQEIIVQSRWTLMFDTDKVPKSILTVDTDITEKKHLEEQFFRAQRMESIGTLAGGVAHNINNNLTPILGYAQLLQGRFLENKDEHLRLLKIIEDNAQQAKALVLQMLSFARGFEGKYTILQVNDLIRNTIHFPMQTLLKQIEFSMDLDPELWTVSGDKNQLHQVLMNLVVNASHSMENGGTLSISTENLYLDEEMTQINCDAKVGNYIVITVTDTGMGMPPQVLQRIFDPFFTTKEVGQGTGLGLSTVLGMIKGHKGFINVSSQVGEGSTFKIFLPSVNQEISPVVPDHLEMCQGRRELILVVDDEAQIREVTKTILETYNYQTLTAENGQEAIAIYEQYQHQISVVLMDMKMPVMDGISAIPELKKINPQVLIIACSGIDVENMLATSHETQVAAILSKPYNNQELLEKLNFVLK